MKPRIIGDAILFSCSPNLIHTKLKGFKNMGIKIATKKIKIESIINQVIIVEY